MQTTITQLFTIGIVGLLLGVGITVGIVNSQQYGMMRMMGMGAAASDMMAGHDVGSDSGMMDMSMSDMMTGLRGKTGDAFDKAFITEMVAHHQGAIEMATAAKANASHEELRQLADAIIAAQTKEIGEMREWYKAWYGVDAPSDGMMGR